MKHIMRTLMAGLGVAALLAGCGGGGGGGDSASDGGTANRPVAVLKASVNGAPLTGGATVPAGSRITLDATGSSTTSGTLSYAWRVQQQPGEAEIANPVAAQTTFDPKLGGEHVISLSVDNGQAVATQQLAFTVTSDHPIAAVSRLERDMPLGQIQLDGRNSQPPTGGDPAKLTYAWTLISKPPTSALTELVASERNQAQPRFTADVDGKYEFALTVGYEDKLSQEPATLVVNILPPAVLPKAVITQISTGDVAMGKTVTFSAAESTIGNRGSTLQYRWSLNDGGSQSPIPALEGAQTSQVSFTPVAALSYHLALTIFDGVQYASASVTVKVDRTPSAPNQVPVAVITNYSGTDPIELEAGGRIDLGGRGSYDLDGNPYSMTLEWTLLEEPAPGAATLTGAGRYWHLTTREYDTEPELYKLQLRVQDTDGAWSAPVVATFKAIRGANRIPIAAPAVMTGSNNVLAGTTVTVSGTGSTDADRNRLTYQWTLADRPDGSTAVMQNANQEMASFVADRPGPYQLSLAVTDSHGARSAPMNLTVHAKAQNYAPEARPYQNFPYDREQPLLISPYLTGMMMFNQGPFDYWPFFSFTANAYDPDGDTLSYLWNLTRKPDGYGRHHISEATQNCLVGARFIATQETIDAYFDRQLTASQWTNCKDLQFSPSSTGAYDLNLFVYDGAQTVGPFNFSVQAATREDYPTLLLENMHRGHKIGGTGYVLGEKPVAASGTTLPSQVLFPLSPTPHSGAQGLTFTHLLANFRGNLVFDTFRLTATGGDYTIANLNAQDVAGIETVSFVGLQDGQVIRKGESVEFQLAWNVADAPQACSESPSYIEGKHFVWSFAILEKPDWTFTYRPISTDLHCTWGG